MPAYTQSSAITRVKTLVSDGGNNLFSDAAYKRFINDANDTVHNILAYAEDEVLIDSVTQIQHAAPATVHEILHVDYDDVPLEPTTVAQLEKRDEKWDTRTAAQPTHWFIGYDAELGVVEGTDTDRYSVGIWPAPTTVETSAIRMISKIRPTAFTSAVDGPNMPTWVQEAVCLEAAAMVLETRGEHRNKELASAYRNLRDFYAGECRRRKDDRFSKCEISVGQPDVDTSPRTLLRDRSVNATGRAGAGD